MAQHSKTSAGTGGGGLFTQQTFTQLGGIINFTECRALRAGGALRINNGSLLAKSGTMIFKKCRAGNSGGGAEVGLHVYIGPEAKMFLRACSARYFGGGRSGPTAVPETLNPKP